MHGTYVTWQCRKRLARVGKTGNLYRFCCKAVELLVTQYFSNLQQPDLLQDVQVYFVGGKTPNTAIELVSQQLTLQIKLHIFRSPFYRTLPYKSDLCKSDKNNTMHEGSSKANRLQRIVKVYPFKDCLNVFLLNVGSCPSSIVELFTNLSH